MEKLFTKIASRVAYVTGKPVAFLACLVVVVVWAVSGPIFGFSDTWQLVINTGTTIITFLMVFVIQASQNRDTAALHLKIDELIRATVPAHNALLDIDNLDEKTLEKIRHRYEELAREATAERDVIDDLDSDAPHRPRKAKPKS